MLLGKGKKNFDAGLLFKTSIMDKCLSFWYKIKGTKGSAIEVFVDGRHFEDLKATKDGKWHKATFTINKVNKKVGCNLCLYPSVPFSFFHNLRALTLLDKSIKRNFRSHGQPGNPPEYRK